MRVYLDDVELPVLLRGGSHGAGRVPVVGVAEGDDVVGARVQPRHQDGELVRLRAGVGEEYNLCIYARPTKKNVIVCWTTETNRTEQAHKTRRHTRALRSPGSLEASASAKSAMAWLR